MHDLDPHAERAAVIAAIARTHRAAGGMVDLSPSAKAARRPLYLGPALAEARRERREAVRENA